MSRLIAAALALILAASAWGYHKVTVSALRSELAEAAAARENLEKKLHQAALEAWKSRNGASDAAFLWRDAEHDEIRRIGGKTTEAIAEAGPEPGGAVDPDAALPVALSDPLFRLYQAAAGPDANAGSGGDRPAAVAIRGQAAAPVPEAPVDNSNAFAIHGQAAGLVR